MTKKKKILIGTISLLLAITLITTALLVIMTKKFKVTNFDNIEYSNHTQGQTITIDNQYKKYFVDSYYENGTELIQNNDSKYGLFSNISGRIVIPTEYTRYTLLATNDTTNKSYFKFYNSNTSANGYIIFDEHGREVFKTEKIDGYKKLNKITIKTRKVDIKDDYKVKNSCRDIEVTDIYFGNTYNINEELYYETWHIIDKEGTEYINLYEIEEGERELIQTINNSIGNKIDNNDILENNIEFLEDGEPIFVTENEKTISNNNDILEIKIFNIDLELVKKIEIEANTSKIAKFRVGDYYYIQYITEGNEDDYDFSTTELGERIYVKVHTYKINLENGRHSKINSDLVVEEIFNTNGNLNSNTQNKDIALLNAYVIKNKEITNPILLLVNDDLQYKEINYAFTDITKISKNRFLAHTNNTNYRIIDKNYEVIADLSQYNNIFTTEDCVIASDSNYTYICNHDGLLLKRYSLGSIIDVKNSNYYIIIENDTETTDIHYKRGNNGEEYEIILTISADSGDTIRESLNFTEVTTFVNDGYAYMLATQNQGSNSTYSIFNFEGDLLSSFTMPTQGITPVHRVYDDHVLVKIADNVILLNR